MINRSASHTGGLATADLYNHERESAAASLYTDRKTSIFLTNTPRVTLAVR
ncbi:hypothetical protein [Paenibacillus sp. OSY-SE]|uniref:hypothetical protein n=1 Tax=Paenibacillus sp. OSY-SE TaxID=1196323 RepID=UPI0012F98717|nr:hypothetical protein [Paenibacillus sp. OSY-SE]